MVLDRRIKIQLAVFLVISVVASAIMIFRYIDAPALLFGVGRYTVTAQFERAAGLYPSANVTYRGTHVGRVKTVRLTDAGVAAELLLDTGIRIPSLLRAEVHSQSAIGEQYVELRPLTGDAPPLKDGDVIPLAETSVPPDIDTLLDSVNRGFTAIPQDSLKTTIDESYTAIGGLGPELSRLVMGSTELAMAADGSLDPLITLIDQSSPVLDSQADTAGAIKQWAAHIATITQQLHSADASVAGVLRNGPPAADEGRRLFQRLQPTLPLLLANLASLGQVALTYQPALEQLLVLFPESVGVVQGPLIANLNTKQDFKGLYLDFNLNFGLPPVCNTGFLPPQQQRVPTFEDHPERPPGDLYCRVPQDSPFNVRGARNYPCLTVPGKRAPTIKMCESDQQYVPLNDGYSWKGDPNATLSGQGVPQLPPDAPPIPVAAAEYDPATGTYIGPDGHTYTRTDLSHTAPEERTWQSMLMPPNAR
jgi:phospholipid/cholesterol/gamma-HCH transport system substrate-binding protein